MYLSEPALASVWDRVHALRSVIPQCSCTGSHLPDAVGTCLAEGETGQAQPDWPELADRLLFAFCLAPERGLPPLRANSRSPLQKEYDSEWDHRSRRSVGGSSPCSWRESASITSGLDLSYPLPRTCYHVQSASLLLLPDPRPQNPRPGSSFFSANEEPLTFNVVLHLTAFSIQATLLARRSRNWPRRRRDWPGAA